MRIVSITAIVATILLVPDVRAQEKLEIGAYCVFDGSILGNDIYGFASDAEADSALRRVMQHTGLEPNFVLRAANVPNASASLQGEKRLILYNQQYMRGIRDATNTEWSEVSILAHELGHHLQGHTLQADGSRPPIELEADKFSGFVLFKMGATLDQAQAAMRMLKTDGGSETHPPKSARLSAITNGWIGARELSDKKPSPAPPSPERVPQPSTPVQSPGSQPGSPTYVSRAVFAGDPVAYFITADNSIVAIAPQTGQLVLVGRKIPPTVPGFAWMYSTASVTYGVAVDGRVYNRDQFGRVYQVGYITNP